LFGNTRERGKPGRPTDLNCGWKVDPRRGGAGGAPALVPVRCTMPGLLRAVMPGAPSPGKASLGGFWVTLAIAALVLLALYLLMDFAEHVG
jgi:hypothetical protein